MNLTVLVYGAKFPDENFKLKVRTLTSKASSALG